MIIYVDLVFFINLIMDFYILSGVKFLNKINVKLYRIVLGSIVGSLSIFLLFLSINTFLLNILKFVISLFMVVVSFGRKRFFYNLFYLYVVSIFLGGSIYLINDSLGYSVDSFIFINNGYSINLILLIIISPIIIFMYVKEYLKYMKKINTMYDVLIKFKNKEIRLEGFLDTGNKLVDPYFRRPIILVNRNYIDLRGKKVIYVPFSSLNNSGLLKCVCCEYILVENNKISNVLIGVSENLEYDCILNERILDYV